MYNIITQNISKIRSVTLILLNFEKKIQKKNSRRF